MIEFCLKIIKKSIELFLFIYKKCIFTEKFIFLNCILKHILFFAIVFLFCEFAHSQNLKLILHSKDSINNSILKSISYNDVHQNENSVFKEVDSISKLLEKLGFINNNFKISKKDSVVYGVINFNNKFEKIRINYNSKHLEKEFIEQFSDTITDKFFEIKFSKTQYILDEIVSLYENLGHSFTTVWLENIKQNSNLLIADLKINLSDKRKIDGVVIKGYDDFPRKFLKHYLQIKPDKPFNLKSLNKIHDLANTIPFVSQINRPQVLFTNDSTKLYLYFKKKTNSNFDGIVGFANDEGSNNVKFNGYINLNLHNVFNKGESLGINWESNKDKNSSLKLNFNTPYIFSSKLNVGGEFSIYKQDTTYVNTKAEFKLGYNINPFNNINTSINTEKSNVLVDVSENSKSFTKNLYGLSYSYRIPEMESSLSNNKFKIDAGILYGTKQSDGEKTPENVFQLFAEYLFKISQRSRIFIKTSSELLNSTEQFENELFKIGGINSIRGFDELSIFTPKYNVTNLEYRLLVNNGSYLYTISDFAVLENINTDETNQIFGIGLGYFLSTKTTIFNISYALGKNYEIPLSFKNSKVHIKITYPF